MYRVVNTFIGTLFSSYYSVYINATRFNF